MEGLAGTDDKDHGRTAVAPSPGQVPTGAWGPPARVPPAVERVDLIDVRDRCGPELVERPDAFHPTPPPPAPPTPTAATPPATRKARRCPPVPTSTLVELAVAVLVLMILVVTVRPNAPAPLSSEAQWADRTAVSIDRLATDVAAATTESALAPAVAGRLRADATRVRAGGPPPDGALRGAWEQALDEVDAAVTAGRSSPQETRSALALAGLDLERLGGEIG